MNFSVLMSVLFLLFWAAQQTTQVQKSTQLKPLQFMVGGTWTAEGEIAGLGKYTAERTYRWTLDSVFIEQHHTMILNGYKIEARGILGWDAGKNQVVGYGFGNDGGIAVTTATFQSGTIIFEGSRIGGFNPGTLRGTFTVKSDNEYTESVEVQKDGKWMPSFSLRWKRKPM